MEAFTDFMLQFALHLKHIGKGEQILAFDKINEAVKSFSKLYQSPLLAGSWSVRVLDFLCQLLKNYAEIADTESKKIGSSDSEMFQVSLRASSGVIELNFAHGVSFCVASYRKR